MIFSAYIREALQSLWGAKQRTLLALIGILTAFVALYYYLNIIKHMYLYRSDDEEVAIPVSRAHAGSWSTAGRCTVLNGGLSDFRLAIHGCGWASVGEIRYRPGRCRPRPRCHRCR